MTIKVIIDTNFLLVPIKFHIDIFSEISKLLNRNYKILIMDGTLRELKNIKEGKLALEILNSQKEAEILVYECKETHVDDCILKFALKEKENNNKVIVCTNDKELKRKLRENDIEIITLKNKSKIDFV